jgi:hypothetical protein
MNEKGDGLLDATRPGPDAQWSKQDQQEVHLSPPPEILEYEEGEAAPLLSPPKQDPQEIRQRVRPDILEEKVDSLLHDIETVRKAGCSKLAQEEIRQTVPGDILMVEEGDHLLGANGTGSEAEWSKQGLEEIRLGHPQEKDREGDDDDDHGEEEEDDDGDTNDDDDTEDDATDDDDDDTDDTDDDEEEEEEGELPPLSEPFTKKQLHKYLTKLVKTIKKQSSPTEEETFANLHLPDYLNINARASDTGILNCNHS